MEKTLNISANLKAVDTIKSVVLYEIANLYRSLSEYSDSCNEKKIGESISTIISTGYILARRVGLTYSDIDRIITDFLDTAIEDNHELELQFSDMSELKRHLSSR